MNPPELTWANALWVYGPLGMGWIVAGVLWFEYRSLVRDVMQGSQAMKVVAQILTKAGPTNQ